MSSKQETGFEEKLTIAEEDIAIEHNRAMYVFNFSLFYFIYLFASNASQQQQYIMSIKCGMAII